jgi:DNA-binding response OmpR family regulator/HPt (histidine-containing phosphotransfer) domain-containing protein
MADAPGGFDEVLEQARRQFVAAARGTLEAFEQLGAQLATRPDADELLTPLRREFHRLNGSAATFGFARVGRMAAALEAVVKKWAGDPQLDRARRSTIVTRFAQVLREEVADGGATPRAPARRLLIVDLKDVAAAPLTVEAAARGYQVERVQADELDEALLDGLPYAIVAGDLLPLFDGLPAVVRLVLRRREPDEVTGASARGIRVLDVRTDPGEVMDAIEALGTERHAVAGGILAVDDDPVMRTIIQVACEFMRQPFVGVDGPDAFRVALRDHEPSVVVVDIDLGGASGLDLVREMRGRRGAGRVCVLVMSGHADPATRDAAFEAGADDYMVKPFALAEFQRRVSGLLDAERRRLSSAGIHAPTGLALPSRTLREFDGEVATRVRAETSLALVAPVALPTNAPDTAAWHRECARLGRVAITSGGGAGFVDDVTLGLLLPSTSRRSVDWFGEQRAARSEGAPAWGAGVVACDAKGGEPSLVALLSAAREALAAGRERGDEVRAWDSGDADAAPDVVVVEDDVPLADLIVFALETKGLTHRHYPDGASALEGLRRMRIRGHRPIVLLDVDLPGLDGHSLHERLRVERPGQYDVVFLSVRGAEADQLRALQAGALDYLSKPVSLRVLLAKLASWRARGGTTA